MRYSGSVCVLLIIFAFFVYQNVEAAYWDGILPVSQLTSAVQHNNERRRGSGKSQKVFVKNRSGGKHAKHLLQYIGYDSYDQSRSSSNILYDTIEPILNNVPIVGHIKGIYHIRNGERERGLETLKTVTTSTAIIGASGVGGPFGAIAASIATQAIITSLDSYFYDQYKPYGLFEYLKRIRHATFGEHVDNIAELAATGMTGYYLKVPTPKVHIHPYVVHIMCSKIHC